MTSPAIAQKGGRVVHDHLPGYVMEVLNKKPCETDPVLHPVEHSQYLVTDPAGDEKWVCGYELHRVGQS